MEAYEKEGKKRAQIKDQISFETYPKLHLVITGNQIDNGVEINGFNRKRTREGEIFEYNR